MAFPPDVQLVTVTCGSGSDFFGEDATVTAEVVPILGGTLKRLTHRETGSFMVKTAREFKGEVGQPATFTVPNSSQAETWVDGQGNFFKDWVYQVLIVVRSGNGKTDRWTQAFRPEPGQTHIDLDLVPDGAVGGGVSAPAPPVTSVNGRAGAVVIPEADPLTPALVAENLTEAAVAEKLPDRLSETALSATIGESIQADEYLPATFAGIGSAALPTRWVFLGDSITLGTSVWNATIGQAVNGHAWPTFAMLASEGRMEIVRNAGVGGDTSAMMLARFDADVTPEDPEVVMLTAGVNDIHQSVPLATFQTNVRAIVAKIRSIGAAPVIGCIYPMRSTADAKTASQWNIWIREYAKSEGVPVVSFDRLADPATGLWPASWVNPAIDLIHPTEGDGGVALGDQALSDIGRMLGAPTIALPPFNNYGTFKNGLFMQAGAASTTPDKPAAVSTTGTGSLPAGTYQYAIASRFYTGSSLPSPIQTITTSDTGKVDLTWTINPAWALVFRKTGSGPWQRIFLGTTLGQKTYTDDGTTTPVNEELPVRDSYSLPATWERTDNNYLWAYTIADPDVRGKALRINPANTTGPRSVGSGVAYIPVVAGDVWEFVGKIRSDGRASAGTRVQLRNEANATLQTIEPTRELKGQFDWGTFSARFKIPTGATRMLMYLTAGPAPEAFVDFAEIDIRKIN